MTMAEWHDECRKRYGEDTGAWKFRCPACGYVASVKEYRDAGFHEGAAYSCIGRVIKGARSAFEVGQKTPGPCDYAGGGLFRLNPITIVDAQDPDGKDIVEQVFDFADDPLIKAGT